MKKVLFLFFIVLGTCAVFADEIFSHKTTRPKKLRRLCQTLRANHANFLKAKS